MNSTNRSQILRSGALLTALLAVAGCSSTGAPTGRTYATPEEAVKAVADAAGQGDQQKIEEIFGAGATEVLWSGDPVQDREDGAHVKAMIQEKVVFQDEGDDTKVVCVGSDAWILPVPLVRADNGWGFDLEAGREEVQNRRIGRNELLAIEALHAYVDAQREYAAQGRDGNPPAFARKVRSTEGRHDGLYWAAGAGDAESPLGPLVAAASDEGYDGSGDGTRPFHGYHFRILTGQGANAPGGQRSYVDSKGLMMGGFAAIAWPATYGNSGIMTFQVNDVGVVFEKDLGSGTGRQAPAMTAYEPDETWTPTKAR